MKQRPDLIQQNKLKEPPALLTKALKEHLKQQKKETQRKEECNEKSYPYIR